MKLKKLLLIIPIIFLSACSDYKVSQSFRETRFTNPVIIASYDNNGQKLSQIKASQAHLETDINTVGSSVQALDIYYDQNKTVFQGSSLIAYSGLTNYAADFQNYQTKTQILPEKSKPEYGDFYRYYENKFKHQDFQNQNAIFVTSKNGSMIGAFVGSKIEIHSGQNEAVTQIRLDNHQIMLYKAYYSTYPISSLKAMSQNEKTAKNKHIKPVKTIDDSITSNKKKS